MMGRAGAEGVLDFMCSPVGSDYAEPYHQTPGGRGGQRDRGASDNRPMKSIRLRPGKERSLLRHHPWVFVDRAIAKGGGDSGQTVRVRIPDQGQCLAWAAFSLCFQNPRPRLEF